MYVVIFRAVINQLDDEYQKMSARMRKLALEEYGCKEFVSITENDIEIALSYWGKEDDIKAWKNDAEHLIAQSLGKDHWYKSYKVQIAKIEREY